MDNFDGSPVEENPSCDEYEMTSQELTDLMPLQPLDGSFQQLVENENYASYPTSSERPDIYGTEAFPPEYEDLTYEELQTVSSTSFTTQSLEEPIEQEREEEDQEDDDDDREDQDISEVTIKENSRKKHTQEEIINKLLEDQISFSEVPELLDDDDVDDCDLETSEVTAKPVAEDPLYEDHAAEFEKELNEQQRYHLKRKGGKEKRRRRRLPAALQGLMGEANLRFARREHEEAIMMCMEIIRQYPHSHEPYHTLGTIYEEKNLINKSLQFYLIAAFLSPGADIWEKLSELSIDQLKDDRQAVFCLGRAIRANPQNLDYHWRRCELFEKLGEKTKALRGYIHMVKFLRSDQGELGLKLAKEIAQIHYENKDVHLAQEALETAFKKHPTFVTAEYVNLMLEVLLQREQYLSCVGVLVQYMGLVLHSRNLDDEGFHKLDLEFQVFSATGCIEPETLEMAMDLRVKLAIAFIHLKKPDLAPPIVSDLMKMSIEKYGDLLIDVSEAYSKTQNSAEAIPLLELLIASDQYNKAAVWLLYGKCLVACKRSEEAAVAYQKVIEMAPQSGEPRLTLSGILQSLGRNEDALAVLSQEVSSEPLDTTFLFQKCEILFKHNQTDEFISTALLFFSKDFVNIKSREEAETVLNIKKLSTKFDAIRELRKGKENSDERLLFIGTEISVEKQWELFKQLCSLLYEEKRFVELQRLTFSSLTSRDLMRDKDRAKEMDFLCLLSCIYNESFYFAFNIMREIIAKFPENNRAWNLLCYIISKADDFRHNRFLLRLVHKNPDNTALSVLNGHNCLVSGTYKFSVAEYCLLYKNGSSDPLIPLMLGITYTHMACQKFSGNKNYLVVTADAFLQKYLEMRSECQESYYNLGRAMHQLSLFTHAVHYYKKALKASPVLTDDGDPDLDLKREIAFNLSLIYRRNDINLAKYYLKKYARFD